MESKGGRQNWKRGAYASANFDGSVPHLLTNEPSYAGGGVDGLNTSYAAQHKRQHVGSVISQESSLPKSPWSAPVNSRPKLESQAAAVQSLYRRSGGTLLPCFAAASSAVSFLYLIALNEILANTPVLLHPPVDNAAITSLHRSYNTWTHQQQHCQHAPTRAPPCTPQQTIKLTD